ncbi:uncharacterized protein METZ01_LOCUS231728, partial [marine metagenome]
ASSRSTARPPGRRSMPRSVARRTRRATRHASKETPPRSSSPGRVPPTSNPDRPT